MSLSDDDYLIRRVSFKYYNDGIIHPEAFTPEFPRDYDGLSVGVAAKITSKGKLKRFNKGMHKKAHGSCVVKFPYLLVKSLDFEFNFKIDSETGIELPNYGLIVGDMEKLVENIEAKLSWANSSKIIFNHPTESWFMPPDDYS